MRLAVFLDRDGTLNEAFIRNGKSYPPDSVAQLQLLPGVEHAVDRLRRAGFLLVVVTNQPDVATGKQTRDVVDAINARILELLPIDGIRVCFHSDAERCDCRKPKPGMIFKASRDWGIDLARSFMVGDRWRDVIAGQAAGCRSILVGESPEEGVSISPDWRAVSLSEAADIILAERDACSAASQDRGSLHGQH
jgi:D-glycero-D-manno-heptose 1,7-bisphosphate phosphatase